ncbi:putative AatA outermembrane domain protein [Escherichia coli P0304777.2]
MRKQLLLNQKKVEYLKNQLYKSNGNIISYYNELDVLNELERKKLSKENEIELYKMHIFYIG